MNDSTYVDRLVEAFVEREGAEPSTARVLAMMVIDAADGGSIPDALSAARTGFPFMFTRSTPSIAPMGETVTARVAREAREAEARGDGPVSTMPVTLRVMREARGA